MSTVQNVLVIKVEEQNAACSEKFNHKNPTDESLS